MINDIWFYMIIISIIFGLITGRIDVVTQSVLQSSALAVEICIGFIGIWSLWLGLMNLAKKSGLITKIAEICSPVIRFLFPKLQSKHPAFEAIIANIAANMLGLGNAATPLGIKAMKELQKSNPYKKVASNEMITFMVINTSSITIVPTTVIGLRLAQGSTNPTEIIVTALLATTVSTIVGIITVRMFEKRRKKFYV